MTISIRPRGWPFFTTRPVWWWLARLDRHWVLGSGVAAAALLSMGAALGYWQSTETVGVTGALAGIQNDQAEQARHAAQRAHARSAEPQPWWSKLPSTAPTPRSAAEQLSADALALAPKVNVQVQRLTFASPSQVTGAPYRSTAVQIEVRGAYADIKRWTGELLARRPHALAVKSIDWRRSGVDAATGTASNATDASIELRLFERAAAR
jgi:hypothetical protein